MKILIATALTNSGIQIGYVQELFKILTQKPPDYVIDINFRENSDVVRTKNELLAFFLTTSYDYIFLIDQNLVNFAEPFFKVAEAYKRTEQVIPLIALGAACPLAKYNFDKVQNIKRSCNLRHNLLDFDIVPAFERHKIPPGSAYSDALLRETQCNNGLLECKEISSRFMMLSRHVLETLIKKNPDIKYSRDPAQTYLPGDLFSFFNSGIDSSVQKFCTADTLFCRMLKALGGLIFVDSRLKLGFCGHEVFSGCYIENLMTRRNFVDDGGIEPQGPMQAPAPQPPRPPQAPRPQIIPVAPLAASANKNVVLESASDPSEVDTKKKKKKKKKRKKR